MKVNYSHDFDSEKSRVEYFSPDGKFGVAYDIQKEKEVFKCIEELICDLEIYICRQEEKVGEGFKTLVGILNKKSENISNIDSVYYYELLKKVQDLLSRVSEMKYNKGEFFRIITEKSNAIINLYMATALEAFLKDARFFISQKNSDYNEDSTEFDFEGEDDGFRVIEVGNKYLLLDLSNKTAEEIRIARDKLCNPCNDCNKLYHLIYRNILNCFDDEAVYPAIKIAINILSNLLPKEENE